MNPIRWWANWWRDLTWVEQASAIAIGVSAAVVLLLLVSTPVPAADDIDRYNATNATITTIVLAMIAMASPIIMGTMTNRSAARAKLAEAKVRQLERQEDWDRQDRVAEKADRTANVLRVNTEAAAQAARVSVEQQAKATEETRGQLRQIHTLVNSNLMIEKTERLKGTRRWLVSLLEIVELKKSLKASVTSESLAEIDTARQEIQALEADIDSRLKATAVADKEAMPRSS